VLDNLRKRVKKTLYGVTPGFAGSFPYFNTKVYFPKNSLIFRLACEQGIYESDNLRLIFDLITPNSVYFDVGANIGVMSVPILRQCSFCKVVSFEPSPLTLKFLNRTAKESPYGERWRIIGKAAGREIGNLDFFMATVELGALDGFKDTKRAGDTHKITVPVTTLDAEWEAMGNPNVSVIKIDVEGAELETLHGALKCIEHERPHILLEWNPVNLKAYNCEPSSLLDFVDQYRYQVLSLPNFIKVEDSVTLRFQMIKTESFLLVPLNK
jgi:FkbM family methyltransferase